MLDKKDKRYVHYRYMYLIFVVSGMTIYKNKCFVWRYYQVFVKDN